MNAQETKLTQMRPGAFDEFYKAWADAENTVAQLQAATDKARQRLSELAKDFARDPESWQVLDRFLYLERLMLDAGQVIDDVRRGTDVPVVRPK